MLVNNAGIFTFGPTTSTTVTDFDRIYDLNVKAPYFLVQALVPRMVERGAGAVVNILSGAAHRGSVAARQARTSRRVVATLRRGTAIRSGFVR